MDINEKISMLEKKISELSHPAIEIPNTHVEHVLAECPKHGEYGQRTRVSTGLVKIPSKPSECPECLKDELRQLTSERDEQDKSARARTVSRLLSELQLPARFQGCTLNNYEANCDEAKRALRVCQVYASKWPDRLKRGGGLVMCGKPGTGKNHLALAIARQVVEEHQSPAIFTTALKIAREYKSTWSKTSTRTEDEVIKQFTRPDLLIVDEVGVQFGSETEKNIMFEIINTRYEQMKPTILISNLSKEELSAFIGERVIDRMNDGGGCTLAFTWDSYRSKS